MRWFPLMLTLLVLGLTAYFLIPFRHDVVDPHRYDDLFVEVAGRYEVPPALVKAVAWQESRLNAEARGGAGELGLMQLTDMASFEWADAERIETFRPDHLVHPRTNAMAGAFYLSKMLRRYAEKDAPEVYALADYNAGRKAVLGWMDGEGATNHMVFLEQMDFPGTKAYIQNVLDFSRAFEVDFKAHPPAPSATDEDLRSLASVESARSATSAMP